MKKNTNPFISGIFLSLALLVASCGKDTEGLVVEARESLRKNDSNAAIIQLKSALQQSPASPEARFLLGEALLASGDVQAANVELRKAYDLKYPAAQVVPLLARTMLELQLHQKIIDEFALVDLVEPKAIADLKTTVAAAYVALDTRDKAQDAIRVALQADPDHAATLQLQARLAADARKFDEALALIDKVTTTSPANATAWQQKGDYLYLGKGDQPGAMAAYHKALSLGPNNIAARSNLIALLLGKRDLKVATEQVELLRKTLPNNPQTLFFDAQLALLNNQPKKALELIGQVRKGAPENAKVLQAAAEIELANGALLQAERSLSRALALSPNLPVLRYMLGQTYLRMGQADKALSALEPLLTSGKADAQSYALAGEANLFLGNMDRAVANFEKAVSKDPSSSIGRIYLTLSKSRSLGLNATVAELQRIAATDKGAYADVALVNIFAQNRDFEKASNSVDAIDKKDPKNPRTASLRGRVQLMSGDVGAARISFERALALDPLFVPAAVSLATIDLNDKKPEAARKRFDAIVAAEPGNVQALLAIAKIRAIEGAGSEDMIRLLDNAVQVSPTAPEPRLLLINHYLDSRNFKSAMTAAQEATVALPNDADLLDALGRVQMASGNVNQAAISFNKLASLEPQSARAYVRLASTKLLSQNKAAAEQSLRRALTIDPAFLEAQIALINLTRADKRYQDALAIARTIQKQRPNDIVGFMMEAEIENSRNNRTAALDVYRAAIKRLPSTALAIRLHAALLSAKQPVDANKWASAWVADHPKDAEFLAYLGDIAIANQDIEGAERRFREVVELQPNNALALNNVAWAMVRLKKPGATSFAERAVSLNPDAPGLIDTLASSLAADKQFDKAVDLQKRAISLAPTEPELRLNLAKIYIQAGNKSAAKVELADLAKTNNNFAHKAEVDRLRQTLSQ